MALRETKPTTPTRRHTVFLDNKNRLTKKKPEKALTAKVSYNAGRNSKGRITTRHKGGRVKRKYRLVDFKREKIGVKGKVKAIEYDPNRSANIALIAYEDGEKRYILSPEGMKVGRIVVTAEDAPIRVGNVLPLKNIPSGMAVHNIELVKGNGGQLCRSAGNSAQIMGISGEYVQIKMPSGEIRLVYGENYATIGEVGNADHSNVKLGKAGRNRYKGIRPSVRGMAMHADGHPHGGGEGKGQIGGQRKDVYGNRFGLKTRRNKRTNKFIIKRRSTKRRPKVKKLN